jgi:hypothetical protein
MALQAKAAQRLACSSVLDLFFKFNIVHLLCNSITYEYIVFNTSWLHKVFIC